MSKVKPGYKSLNIDIPERLFKDLAKRCIEDGITKKEFIKLVLEEKLYSEQTKKSNEE